MSLQSAEHVWTLYIFPCPRYRQPTVKQFSIVIWFGVTAVCSRTQRWLIWQNASKHLLNPVFILQILNPVVILSDRHMVVGLQEDLETVCTATHLPQAALPAWKTALSAWKATLPA